MTNTNTTQRSSAAAARALTLCLLAAAAALLLPARANAQQWTTNGNNINNTNTGAVGVGTNAPARGSNSDLVIGPGADAAASQMEFYGASKSSVIAHVDSSGLGFWVNGPTWINPMVISPAGNVGIGTTNPQYGRLQVNKVIRIDDDSGSLVGSDTLGNAPMLYLGTISGGSAFQWNAGGGIDLWQYHGGWARPFTFTKTGNLGIGTNAPAARLSITDAAAWQASNIGALYVNASNPVGAGLNLHASGANGRNYLLLSTASSASPAGGTFSIYDATLGGEAGYRLVLNSAGNLGLGTLTPAQKLDVAGNVNAAGLCLGGDCKTAWSQVGGGGSSQWTTSGSNVYYNTGNVGVGTTAPSSKLFVGSGTAAVQALPGLNVALGGNSYISASNGTVNTFVGSDISSYGIVGTLSNHPLGLRANNTLAVTVMPDGKVGIGTSSPSTALHVVGDITATGNISAKYQDVAEWVPSTQKLAAGTVVVLDADKSNHVVASGAPYDTKVAGVISERPGIALGEQGEGKLLVATTGRVRVRVDATRAPVKVGDLLVTSGLEGVAMKSVPVDLAGTPIHRPGTIIGKALEPLEKGTGEILVLLSLQ